jgi:hypothetical protein
VVDGRRVFQYSLDTAAASGSGDESSGDETEVVGAKSTTSVRRAIYNSMPYFSRKAEINGLDEQEDEAWVIDIDAAQSCKCQYYNKWGYCVHYVAVCETLSIQYLGRRKMVVALVNRRIQTAAAKVENKKKEKERAKRVAKKARDAARKAEQEGIDPTARGGRPSRAGGKYEK